MGGEFLEGGYEHGVEGTKCRECRESWEGVSGAVYVGRRERQGTVGCSDVPGGAGARLAIGLSVLYSDSPRRFRREHNHRTGGTGVGARARKRRPAQPGIGCRRQDDGRFGQCAWNFEFLESRTGKHSGKPLFQELRLHWAGLVALQL